MTHIQKSAQQNLNLRIQLDGLVFIMLRSNLLNEGLYENNQESLI